MPTVAEIASRYRLVALAVLASAALHAAVMVGMPARIEAVDDGAAAIFVARLAANVLKPPAPTAPIPEARPRPRPAPRALPPEAFAALPTATDVPNASDVAPASDVTPAEAGAQLLPAPEIVALAQPATPVLAFEPGTFPVEALPAALSIDYRLTSAFADGRATYHWDRDGDSYRIRGEAEAEGFFTLFLEGRIVQQSRGTVSASGLRPERFSERRPNAAEEGLEFDWPGRRITFERGGERRTTALTDNTVDWLSMIFQLAHVPPSAAAVEMQVFTQRRMYRFRLRVLGVEEIEIPLGKVRALHLRHEDPAKDETVDVWLGLDQYHLPVKLRFPAARNRLVVEQVATRVTSR